MYTLAKFFDTEPMKNLISPLAFRPEKVVYVIDNSKHTMEQFENIKRVLEDKIENVIVKAIPTPCTSIGTVKNAIDNILSVHEDVVFDVGGGRDLMLIAAGEQLALRQLKVFYVDINRKCLINISGCEKLVEEFVLPSFTVNDFIVSTGASISSFFHYKPDMKDSVMIDDILAVFDVMRKDFRRWARFASSMAKAISDRENGLKDREVFLPKFLENGPKKTKSPCDHELVEELFEKGILVEYEKKDGYLINFKNNRIMRLFSDTGAWLEYYTYIQCVRAGFFEDVQISARIDWDGEKVDFRVAESEIDLIMTKDISCVFVSCKLGTVSREALYEISLMCRKFGGKFARAAIVTGSLMKDNDLGLYKKAKELSVAIIDKKDIEKNMVAKKLKSIVNGTFQF